MNDETVQELERKKRFLKRYRKNEALIARLKSKLAFTNDRIYGLRASSLSGMPRGGEPITLEDLVADKQELEARIDRLSEKGRKLRAEILERIDDLDDPRYAEILESFFIDCKDFETIAEEIGFTERHVIRLYSEGILALSVSCQ